MIKIPISVGELIDKLSILHIKKQRVKDTSKLVEINKEYELLKDLSQPFLGIKEVFNLYDELIKTNGDLWDIEDKIRIKEKNKEFDSEFIDLARKVYYTNDDRFDLKNQINNSTGSELKEQKDYQDYKN